MAGRGRRKKNNNRAGKLCIGMIVIAFVAVMSVQIIRVYQKDQEYMQQEASLQKQLEEETARGEQLSSYETYTKSQQYVEDTAKSKLAGFLLPSILRWRRFYPALLWRKKYVR